jgi:hypothetical protein
VVIEKMSKKYLIGCLICGVFLCSNGLDANWVDEQLQALSHEEKENLSFFLGKPSKKII